MADKNITDFPEKTTLDSADFLLLDDTTSGTTKKVAADNLASGVDKQALSADLVSTDTPNVLAQGSDNLLAVDPADLISTDASNSLVQGTDNLLFVAAAAGGGGIEAECHARITSPLANYQLSTSRKEIIFDSVMFDTNGYYDNTTGRFTPLEAGIYAVLFQVKFSDITSGAVAIKVDIQLNGLNDTDNTEAGQYIIGNNNGNNGGLFWCVHDLNGTTDYLSVEAFVASNAAEIRYSTMTVFKLA